MSQFSRGSIAALIDDYGLNLDGGQTEKIVAAWLGEYDASWIVKAIVEAVYRGRYQVKSVDGILRQWQRLGQPRCHFKSDFERERLDNFSFVPSPEISEIPSQSLDLVIPDPELLESPLPAATSNPISHEYLDPDELKPFQHHHLPVSRFSSPTRLNLPKTSKDLVAEAQTGIMSKLEDRSIPLPPRLQLLDTLKRAISEQPKLDLDLPIQTLQNEPPIPFRGMYGEEILESSH